MARRNTGREKRCRQTAKHTERHTVTDTHVHTDIDLHSNTHPDSHSLTQVLEAMRLNYVMCKTQTRRPPSSRTCVLHGLD